MIKNKRTLLWDVPIVLVVAFGITCIGVVILALCLLVFSISEEMVEGGILLLYILSCFMAGVIMGKKRKIKRFLWGMFIGVVYYSVLYAASYLLVDSLEYVIFDVITSLTVCCASATLGGMLS